MASPSGVGGVTMTEAEEAQLLADYGTSDAFDLALELQAVSTHKNILNEANLFLTGGDDRSHDDEESEGGGSVAYRIQHMDPSVPISLMLLQCGIGIAADACSSLSMAQAVGARENSTGPATVTVSDEAVRRTKKFMDEMELLITGGRTITAPRSNSSAGGDDNEDESLAQLLAEVDKELQNTDYHFSASKDPEFARQLEEERERCLADLSPVHQPEVFDDDAELIDPAECERIAEAVQSRPLEPILDESERQLFAEMEATEAVMLSKRQQQAAESIQLSAASAREAQIEITNFVAALPHQPVLMSVGDVLAQISTMESRDTAMEAQVRAQVSAIQRQKASATLERQLQAINEAKASSGQMAFVPLISKIDTLLPATTLQPTPRGEVEMNRGVEPGAEAISTKRAREPLSVAAMQKRNAIKDVMLKREANERRLMRIEEERVNAMQRNLEALLSRISAEIKNVFSEEAASRHQTKADEAIASADFVLREQRARSEVIQALRNKALVQEAKAKNNLSEEENACRQLIQSSEVFAFGDIEKGEKEERKATEGRLAAMALLLQQVESQLLARLAAETEANSLLLSKYSDIITRQSIASASVDGYGEAFPSYSDVSALQSSGEICSVGHGARSYVLQQQLALRQQWSHDNRAAITSSLQGISIALNAAVSQRQRSGNRKKGRGMDGQDTAIRQEREEPSSEEDPQLPLGLAGAESDGGVRLNAKLLKKINAQLFSAVAGSNMCRAQQIFRFMSAALEGVSDIDYASIKGLSVSTASAAATADNVFGSSNACVNVAKFVRHLNLSGNSLTSINFERLLDALPSLRTLNVSDNSLALSAASEADAVANAAAAGSSQMSALDISANKVLDFSFLSASPNLVALTAYSNRIESSESLKLSPKLSTVEISRNKLKELNGLSSLVTLSSVDASRNEVSSMDPLQHNLLLTKVFLSNNLLASLPNRLPLALLRQLFLSENKLVAIPRELMWLPMLSVLHLDSNQIRDISGLAFCPLLVTLRVAFNQLSNPSDFLPLMSCKRLENLAINDNPVMLMQSTAKESIQIVFASCPLLRELNNEAVQEAARGQALMEVLSKRGFGFFVGAGALWGSNIHWGAPVSTTAEGLLRFSSAWTASLSANSASGAANNGTRERLGFAFDRQLYQLQQEYDVVTVANNRKLQNAIATEDCLADRLKTKKSSGGVVSAPHHMSDSIAEQNYIESLQLSQKHLLALRDAPTPQLCFNRHSASATYAHRAQQQREQQARRYVADWIYRSLLCRKAVREFRAMREASEAGRMRRYERAARVIQPVWRGAWVRHRLRKAKVLDDDDDDELFQKVEVGDFGISTQKSSTSSLFQQALASHPHAPRFDVSSFVTKSKLEAAGEAVRPSSNPARRDMSSTLQGSNEQRASSPPPQRSQLDEEWSNAISSQIRKKNKKMEAGRAEAIRKEFLTDPLKAKARIAGAK